MSITCKFHVNFLFLWECWLRNDRKLFAELGHEVMVLESKTHNDESESGQKTNAASYSSTVDTQRTLQSAQSVYRLHYTCVAPNSSLCEYPPTHLNLLTLPPCQSSGEMAWRLARKMSDVTLELSLRLFSCQICV